MPRGERNGKGNLKQSKGQEVESDIGDVMKMIDTITSCLAKFTLRFENCHSSTQSSKDITPNTCRVDEEGYLCISIIACPCINSFDILWHSWLFAYVFHSSMFFLFLLFKKLWMFVCFLFDQSLLALCQKSKNI